MDSQKAIDFILDRLQRELPSDLKYHAAIHTTSVIRNCRKIAEAEGISDSDLKLILTAAAYHDSGFLEVYENNEKIGCEIAKKALVRYGFTEDEISTICGMIMATQPSQTPKNKLEMILCDADLFYLGGDQYEEIANSLYDELQLHGHDMTQEEWLNLQLHSLKEHQYFTDFAIQSRELKKQSTLAMLQTQMPGFRKSGS